MKSTTPWPIQPEGIPRSETGVPWARIPRRVLGDILAWADMRQCHAERSRPARGMLIRDEQLLPQAADAVVGRLMNVDMAVLVEAEQRRLRIIPIICEVAGHTLAELHRFLGAIFLDARAKFFDIPGRIAADQKLPRLRN